MIIMILLLLLWPRAAVAGQVGFGEKIMVETIDVRGVKILFSLLSEPGCW